MSMISKSEIKYIQSLYQKKYRTAYNEFIVEGPKLVSELLLSEFEVVKVYALPIFASNVPAKYLTIIDEITLGKISQLATPNQVIAIAKMPVNPQLHTANATINLVLDDVQDPGNLGTIIRIADWYGINNIIASIGSADCYNTKVIQASMGSIFRVGIQYTNIADWLALQTTAIYGAMLQGKNYKTVAMPTKAILVMGNESKGISQAVTPFIQYPITIERVGAAESLNVAVATGILLSKFI